MIISQTLFQRHDWPKTTDLIPKDPNTGHHSFDTVESELIPVRVPPRRRYPFPTRATTPSSSPTPGSRRTTSSSRRRHPSPTRATSLATDTLPNTRDHILIPSRRRPPFPIRAARSSSLLVADNLSCTRGQAIRPLPSESVFDPVRPLPFAQLTIFFWCRSAWNGNPNQ